MESNMYNIYTILIILIFHSIVTLYAVYLSFKCNKGFSFGGFFTSIFFPYIYIIYKYATSDTFCDIIKSEEKITKN